MYTFQTAKKFNFSQSRFEQKDYKDALPLMEKLASMHPATESTYAGYLSLARCYAETGKIKEFCQTVDKAFAVKSNDPAGWRFAGQEMDYLGHYDEAVKYYREYLKRFPGQSDSQQISKRLDIVSFKGQQAQQLKEVEEGFTLDSDTDDLREFVVYLDPAHSNVSDTAIAQLMLGLISSPVTPAKKSSSLKCSSSSSGTSLSRTAHGSRSRQPFPMCCSALPRPAGSLRIMSACTLFMTQN